MIAVPIVSVILVFLGSFSPSRAFRDLRSFKDGLKLVVDLSSRDIYNSTGIYNTSHTPGYLPWNTYNYCNAPHVNAAHYVTPSVSGAKLVYMNMVMRHHKVRSSRPETPTRNSIACRERRTIYTLKKTNVIRSHGIAPTSNSLASVEEVWTSSMRPYHPRNTPS